MKLLIPAAAAAVLVALAGCDRPASTTTTVVKEPTPPASTTVVQTPAPTKLRLDTGAASQCGNPSVTFTANDTITIQFDGGKKLVVLLPAFMGTSLTLYIATDGSTYYDAALTQPARRG